MQLPFIEHGDPVAKHFGVRKNVRGEKYGSALAFQIENDVAHFAPADRIEPGHRLVEKKYLRIVKNGLRDADALEHALRKFPELHVARGRKAHALEISFHALAPLGRAIAGKSRVVIEKFARRQIIVEIGLLGEITDLAVHGDVINRAAADTCAA